MLLDSGLWRTVLVIDTGLCFVGWWGWYTTELSPMELMAVATFL